jgi:uncharacterized membrane protein YfcA
MGAYLPATPGRVSSYAREVTAILAAAAVVAAAFIKGAIGFGFPTLATPLLSLVMDVKTAVVVLIVPNIVMDGIQFARRGAPLAVVRRFAVLLIFGAAGTVLGTRLLVTLPPRVAALILGAFILTFAGLSATGATPRVRPGWEPWLSPLAGLLAGIIGGITNVPGTPLVLYFHALGLGKHEFVSSVAFSFVVYKVVQLAAVTAYGLLPPSLLIPSLGLTVVALAAFALGLRVQDRLEQRAFNRLVLGFLTLLGAWLVLRNLR